MVSEHVRTEDLGPEDLLPLFQVTHCMRVRYHALLPTLHICIYAVSTGRSIQDCEAIHPAITYRNAANEKDGAQTMRQGLRCVLHTAAAPCHLNYAI